MIDSPSSTPITTVSVHLGAHESDDEICPASHCSAPLCRDLILSIISCVFHFNTLLIIFRAAINTDFNCCPVFPLGSEAVAMETESGASVWSLTSMQLDERKEGAPSYLYFMSQGLLTKKDASHKSGEEAYLMMHRVTPCPRRCINALFWN